MLLPARFRLLKCVRFYLNVVSSLMINCRSVVFLLHIFLVVVHVVIVVKECNGNMRSDYYIKLFKRPVKLFIQLKPFI